MSALVGTVMGRASGGDGKASLPPLIQITPCVKQHIYRFFSSAVATNVGVSIANIMGALGGVCTLTNSTVQAFTGSFRLKRITIWSAVSSSVATVPTLAWTLSSDAYVPD